MARRKIPLALAGSALTVAVVLAAQVEAKKPANLKPQFRSESIGFDEFRGGGAPAPDFALQDAPLGEAFAPSAAGHSAGQGSTLVSHGNALYVLDPDSGDLVRTVDGKAKARVKLKPGASQMVLDATRKRLYVADRGADRIAVVHADTMKVIDGFTVREPFGVALSPKGDTLLITSVADRKLIALDTNAMKRSFQHKLLAEPRGVAISPSGDAAMIGFLSTGAVGKLDLSNDKARPRYVALDPVQAKRAQNNFQQGFQPQAALPVNNLNRIGNEQPRPVDVMLDDENIGRTFARNAFAVGFVGHDIAVVPHQLSTPHLAAGGQESSGSYGGGDGFTSPVTHRLSFLREAEGKPTQLAHAATRIHQPRAMAYDAGRDTLFVVGYGSDEVLAVADVSQSSMHLAWLRPVGNATACAPDGVTVDQGGSVHVRCALTRNVVTLDLDDDGAIAKTTVGDELAKTTLSASALRGKSIFRRGNDHRLSQGGSMACAGCHPEGRTDGLSWRIEGHTLQTPLLGGRLAGAHPFKWDGKDATLDVSLNNTVRRLGGSGLAENDRKDLQAFVMSMPAPRKPTGKNPDSIARGAKLFEAQGCDACHSGSNYADGQSHDLGTNIGPVDTPSLLGLAASAPYYHDGSARTLRALLFGNAAVHGMVNAEAMTDDEVDDMVAFLETL